MKSVRLILLLLMVSSCYGSSEERTVLSEQHVSFAALSDYELEEKLGATLLTSSTPQKEYSTIAIRSVRYDERNDRNPESITQATKIALLAMPQASVTGPLDYNHAKFDAKRFTVSFASNSNQRSYDREHVLLFTDDRVVHLIHTVRSGHVKSSSSDFAQLVNSIEEEGEHHAL